MVTARSGRVGRLVASLILSVLVAGCDEKARDFARRTAAILQQRSEQLSRKIAAETAAYNAAAVAATEAQRALADTTLANERNARTIALAADYDEDRKPVSRWQTDLAEYAQIDHRLTRDLLIADVDAGSLFLQKLQALKIEQDRVEALARLLEALAQKPTLTQDLEALAGFAEDTKTEFDQKVCEALGKDKSAAGQAAFKAKGCK
jgi:hypothetical protein